MTPTVLYQAGLALTIPVGWEIEIDSGAGEPIPGDKAGLVATPRTHAANFGLPALRGDFGSGAVERMVSGDAFISLLEESPEVLGSQLYSNEGVPEITADRFAPETMQRSMRGMSGSQAFFHLGGRAFALYVVVGSHFRRAEVLDDVNAVLASLVID